jgi:protein-disulfide isomerase
VSVRALPVTFVLCAGLAAASRPAAADVLGFDPAAVYQAPLGDAPRRGPDDALVTLVMWSDFSCRYCNKLEPTLEQVDRMYPGQLRWVFRHLPLDEDDIIAAEASLAAGAQGRFWPMKDRLFGVRGRVDRAAVELIAGDLGLDMVRFRADLDAGTYQPAVRADIAAAKALGITGTPTVFVNGRPLRGSQALRNYVDVVDHELVRAASLVKTGVAPSAAYAQLVANGRPSADEPTIAPAAPAVELDATAQYTVGLGLPGHQRGPDDALVTVVVWSDFQCGFCARNAPDLDRLVRNHPDDVRIIYRHMPIAGHRDAQLAAEASVAAAAQGKFWAFHDQLFAAQDKLDRAGLEGAAVAAGLDMAPFRAALDDRRYHEAVAAEAAAASALGVTGTPAMFVNGSPVEGAVGYDAIAALFDAHRSAAGSLIAHGIERRDVYGMVMLSGIDRDRSDPSRIPRPGEGQVTLELDPVDRGAAAVAACRGRDEARALSFAARLTGAKRAIVDDTCAALGFDLAR